MSDLPIEFSLPLPVDGHLGDFDDVADLQTKGRLVVSVRNARLLHPGVGRQFALKDQRRDSQKNELTQQIL